MAVCARQYIDGIDPQGGELTRDDREEFCKPAGKNKALIACVSSILKPGKAITVSLQDNRWLTGPALQQPRIRRVQSFLEQLLELGQQAA